MEVDILIKDVMECDYLLLRCEIGPGDLKSVYICSDREDGLYQNDTCVILCVQLC